MIDTSTFAQWMGLLSDRFNRALAAPTQRAYFELLSRELTTAEFVAGAEQCFARCTYWPSPAEITAAAKPRGSSELAGAEAFADILRWNGTPELMAEARRRLSAPALRAFLAVGGPAKFRALTTDEEPFVRKAFVSAFVAAAGEAIARAGQEGRIEQPRTRRIASGPERLGELIGTVLP